MNIKIEFSDKELDEFRQVIKLCQPDVGISSGALGRVIQAYFTKNYTTELIKVECGLNSKMIQNNRESYVEVAPNKRIFYDYIIDEMIQRGLLVEYWIHTEDMYGNKVYIDDEKKTPRKRKVYKVV